MKDIRLTHPEQRALQELVRYLRQSAADQIQEIALFGSKASGDSRPDSDIDVLVILSQEDRQLRRAILRQAARISLAHDVLLSPRVIGAERWSRMRGFSLYSNIVREAARLKLEAGELALASAGLAG